ncbi:hypothetical protein CCR84_12500 [Rhodocyclus purpureus]|nr:hypothetical protein [Rhodocyclus purpureus]
MHTYPEGSSCAGRSAWWITREGITATDWAETAEAGQAAIDAAAEMPMAQFRRLRAQQILAEIAEPLDELQRCGGLDLLPQADPAQGEEYRRGYRAALLAMAHHVGGQLRDIETTV